MNNQGLLVLAGGGHSHALVLKQWAMRPHRRPEQEIILVNRNSTTLYSGMVPGLIARTPRLLAFQRQIARGSLLILLVLGELLLQLKLLACELVPQQLSLTMRHLMYAKTPCGVSKLINRLYAARIAPGQKLHPREENAHIEREPAALEGGAGGACARSSPLRGASERSSAHRYDELLSICVDGHGVAGARLRPPHAGHSAGVLELAVAQRQRKRACAKPTSSPAAATARQNGVATPSVCVLNSKRRAPRHRPVHSMRLRRWSLGCYAQMVHRCGADEDLPGREG